MQIFAQTLDGKTVAIEIQETWRIIDIKKKIQERIGFAPDEQKLIYQGSILEDDKTADEYQIAEKSVINVIKRLKSGIQIFAKTMDGKTVGFEIQETERVSDIKKKIQEKIGLASDEQKLVFNGGILIDDDKTAEEYQITEKSVITVLARLRGGPQIFAKTMDGKTVAFEIQRTERIIDVKKKIEEKIGLAPDEQKLVFQGGILQDDKTADEYQIAEKSVIDVLPLGSIQIQIKLIDGIIESIFVMETERIIDTKRKIQERIRLAPDEHIWIYRGCMLEDERFLDEYGITDGSQIDICTKLRCEMKVFVKTPNSETIDIGVNKCEKVSSLRRKIESATRIASDKQILLHERTVLNTDDPNKTIEEFGLKDRSIIRVIHE